MSKQRRIAWDERQKASFNARKHLPRLVSDYFALGREILAGQKDPAHLHALRLATKRLRYTLELFRPCYGPGLKTRLATLQKNQQMLGEINDTVAAERAMKEIWDGKAPQQKRVEQFLRRQGEAKADEFQKYWMEQFDAPGQERRWTSYLARRSHRPEHKV